MGKIALALVFMSTLFFSGIAIGAGIPISDPTAECIDCHASIHPGIVKDWQESRHATQGIEQNRARSRQKFCRGLCGVPHAEAQRA